MGSLVFKAIAKNGFDKLPKSTYNSAFDIPVRMLLEEEEKTLSSVFTGTKKAVLFVNVATK